MIAIPALAAFFAALSPVLKGSKLLALLASLAVSALSYPLLAGFDLSNGGFQFKEDYLLLPSLGIHYSLGLDGLSLWFVLLTALVTPLVVLGSFSGVQKNVRGYFSCLLLLESAMLGTLAARDLFLFYLFWELMLIPVFFLIGVWGGPGRVKATVKFVLFTLFGSLLMLVALLYVTHEAHSFDYAVLLEHHFSEDVQFWCFLAFALAFLIKVPLFPLHGWLPDAYAEAPPGATVMLSALMVKLGAYGFLRFCPTLFPAAAKAFAPWLMVLALAGVLHGALMATIQTDFKRLAAYSSLSHMGMAFLGILTFTVAGLQAGVFLMVAHGVYMAGLFLLMGFLEERRGSRLMTDYGGAAQTAPLLAVLFLWLMAAAVSLPGLAGFVGEILVLVPLFKANALYASLALVGFVLSAWYFFNLYGRLFFGAPRDAGKSLSPDLNFREVLALLPLAALALWLGLSPNIILRSTEKSLQMNVVERLKPPPAMTDFAAQQRFQQEVQRDRQGNGK
jgi:NADH-quinone oxidoreductase subunit M